MLSTSSLAAIVEKKDVARNEGIEFELSGGDCVRVDSAWFISRLLFSCFHPTEIHGFSCDKPIGHIRQRAGYQENLTFRVSSGDDPVSSHVFRAIHCFIGDVDKLMNIADIFARIGCNSKADGHLNFLVAAFQSRIADHDSDAFCNELSIVLVCPR